MLDDYFEMSLERNSNGSVQEITTMKTIMFKLQFIITFDAFLRFLFRMQ